MATPRSQAKRSTCGWPLWVWTGQAHLGPPLFQYSWNKHSCPFLLGERHICRFNQPRIQSSLFEFPAAVNQLQTPNCRAKMLFWIRGWLNPWMQGANGSQTFLRDFQLGRGRVGPPKPSAIQGSTVYLTHIHLWLLIQIKLGHFHQEIFFFLGGRGTGGKYPSEPTKILLAPVPLQHSDEHFSASFPAPQLKKDFVSCGRRSSCR